MSIGEAVAAASAYLTEHPDEVVDAVRRAIPIELVVRPAEEVSP